MITIKFLLPSLIIGSTFVYSQDCNTGYTYQSTLPDNVNNINNDNNCFSDDDLTVLDNFISINELNYDSPLDLGLQTWLSGRLKIWVATYVAGGSSGITQIIDQLPDNIGQLSELTTLFIEKHDLTELPENFTLLSSLVYLYISNNYITSLPEDFGNLTSLATLDLGYNYLESIPESIGDLENLIYLFLLVVFHSHKLQFSILILF